MPTLRFHFDYLSPYAYLAWHRIHDVAAEVQPVPTLLAGLLSAHGTKGPAEVPAKRLWVFKDTLRHAHALGLPFAPPPSHPFNPLLALRVSGLVGGDAQRALITALFAVAWGGQRHPEGGLEQPAVVARAASAAGLDGDGLVAEAQGPAAKARLRDDTAEAIAAGVFGVPSVRVGDEVFWGLDALPHVARHLAGEDPVTPALVAAWADLPASASRT